MWRALKESQHAPAGVADLSLTAVGEQGVVAFGGLGSKRASAALNQLQPATSTWSTMNAAGVRLLSRRLPSNVCSQLAAAYLPDLNTTTLGMWDRVCASRAGAHVSLQANSFSRAPS